MIPKVLRTITSILPVDSERTGACNNCGECCKLPFRCGFLKDADDGNSYCSIYKIRPPTCRKFPRTESQWNDVKDVCGFSFPVTFTELDKSK